MLFLCFQRLGYVSKNELYTKIMGSALMVLAFLLTGGS